MDRLRAIGIPDAVPRQGGNPPATRHRGLDEMQAATALAATLGADLILLSDVSGILDGKGQRIAEMTAEKAEQLIELAERKNLKIMVDHTFLFSGAVRKIREVVDANDLDVVPLER